MMTMKEARTFTGEGHGQIGAAMKRWPTKNPLLAAFYSIARGHPIAVKGDRDERDRAWAHRRYYRYLGWCQVSCHCHAGIVADAYGEPAECQDCNGSGAYWVHKTDRTALYPGGPFTGRQHGLYHRTPKWDGA